MRASIVVLAAIAAVVTAKAVEQVLQCPQCTPKIDVKASVMEAYKKHRAHVAVIGDYGDCPVTYAGYTWDVNWGDGDEYKKHQDPMGPYQADHTYAKKGKYPVEVSLCAHQPGCADGCSTYKGTINVKP